MNGHARALELAAAEIDFSLTAAERTVLTTHLDGCTACRRSVAGFATDAATIARLPVAALTPEQSERILASWLRPPARVPVVRYLAIAALLALLAMTSLVVGAELLHRLETPRQLAVEPSPSDPATAPPSSSALPATPTASLETPAISAEESPDAPTVSAAATPPADAAPPILDARWNLIAVPGPVGRFTSIAELDGRLYAVTAREGDPSIFNLWTSTDAVTWEPVDTGGYSPGRIASDGSRLIAIPDFGGPDTRASVDGRSWQQLAGLGPEDIAVSVAAEGTVVYATGSSSSDAGLWHLAGTTWEPVELPNAEGILSVQDGHPAVVHQIVATTRGWLAVGVGPSGAVSDPPEARAWTSVGGEIWTAQAIPDVEGTSAVGAWGRWPETEVVIGGAVPQNGRAVAWVRRGDTWTSATFHGSEVAAGTLGPMVELNGVLLAVGYDDASERTDSGELRSVLWASSEGANWWPFDGGDLSTGLIEDVFVTREGRILGAGLQFDGAARRGFESAYRPALFELVQGG